MIVLVTGAAGFIGHHLVPLLLEKGHHVIALDRDANKLKSFNWYSKVEFISYDLFSETPLVLKKSAIPDVMIHLAWAGLPNYKDSFHIDKNLPADKRFLTSMIAQGIKHIIVTGTCLEYGMQNGCLSVDMETQTQNPYAIAKDFIRKYLQELKKEYTFRLHWARLFYIYGKGQNPNALIPQLDQAIDNGETVFNMSGGEQIRDFLPVTEVAHQLYQLMYDNSDNDIVNICSGKPVTVKEFVENHITARNAKIELNLGYYPYPDWEPMEFWGCNNLMNSSK